MDDDALFLRGHDFPSVTGHTVERLKASHLDFGAQTYRGAGAVHGHITASEDQHALPQFGRLGKAHVT